MKGKQKRGNRKKARELEKVLATVRKAFWALKPYEMDCQLIHTAMADLAVTERNVENHLIYSVDTNRWKRRWRSEQQEREQTLTTLFPFSRCERVSEDGEEAIDIESEVVPMR
jgi:hypothetical protein